ncbi:MAG: hypothetical protein ACOX62_03735 [Christensenellales bacterium]
MVKRERFFRVFALPDDQSIIKDHRFFARFLKVMERIGKALRNPAKDTVLSGVADNQVGIGFAFGLQEALDQLGAFLGPLVFTAVFYFAGKSGISEYQSGYQLLAVPFVCLMLFLYFIFRAQKDQGLEFASFGSKQGVSKRKTGTGILELHRVCFFLRSRFRQFQHDRLPFEGEPADVRWQYYYAVFSSDACRRPDGDDRWEGV